MLFYKLCFTLTFSVFIFMISDFRNKKTSPLFMHVWLIIMRAGYLIPLFCSIFFVWKLQSVTLYSWIALLLMACGSLIVFAAKKELGKLHSWAGYAATETERFCISGIYAWIRHPLYLGIMISDIGIAFIIIPNFQINLQLALTFLIGSFFTFIFLVISSLKETKYLADKFGKSFISYALQVNAFLPLRKFRNTTDVEL